MRLARFDLAHNSNSFAPIDGQLKTRTDWCDEILSRAIIVLVLTVIRLEFDA